MKQCESLGTEPDDDEGGGLALPENLLPFLVAFACQKYAAHPGI